MKPRKLTPRQFLFAHAYVAMKNATEAYKMAYSTDGMTDHTIAVEASRVLRHTGVSLKIDELLEAHREAHGVTVDTLAREYDDAISQGLRMGKTSAVISGITGKAKLFGLSVDKKDVTGSIDFKPPQIEFSGEPVNASDSP